MTTTYARERTLQDEIAPAVEQRVPGVDVLAVELLSPSRFCVYIDHRDGVDHALCERVTNLLRGYLDRYTVDVSSPGIERPLRTHEHFRNAVGRQVAIRTETEIGGRKKFKGTITAADPKQLALAGANGERLTIPYDSIVRGNLVDEGH